MSSSLPTCPVWPNCTTVWGEDCQFEADPDVVSCGVFGLPRVEDILTLPDTGWDWRRYGYEMVAGSD